MSDLSHPPDLSEAPGFQADPYAPDYGFDQGQAGPGYRVPPGNEPAEQALLGAILTNNDLLDKAAETLAAEHFFVPANGRVFAACVAFRERGRAATPITLKEYFETDGDLRDIGGFAYLAELAANTDIVPDIAAYAKTIYDAYLRRQLITLGTDIVNDSYRHEVDTTAQDLLEDAESRLYVMAESHVAEGGFKPFGAVLNAAIAVAEQALKRDTPLTGVTTGLIELDKMLGGLQRSDLLILAGRPGMGKTALATTIAFNAAKAYADKQGKEGAVTAFFSLEMSAEQLATRVLSTVARISSDAIR